MSIVEVDQAVVDAVRAVVQRWSQQGNYENRRQGKVGASLAADLDQLHEAFYASSLGSTGSER